MIKRCLVCGKKFAVYPCYAKLGRGKYCSQKCCGKSQRTSEQRKCLFCGKKFHAFQSQIKRGNAKYCSRKCFNSSRIGKIKRCPICNKAFYSYRSDDKFGKRVYCSWKCCVKGRKGENHWNWQKGKSFEPYTSDWTEILKESIRKRDKYTCGICGKLQADEVLDVHHIDYDKKNCNPINLVALCHSCHAKTNQNRNYWIKYFTS
jgi:hypothetical protein